MTVIAPRVGVLDALAAPRDHVGHRVVCTRCNSVDDLSADKMRTALGAVAESRLLVVDRSGSITLNVLCPDCRASDSPRRA